MLSHSPTETKKFAKELATELLKKPPKRKGAFVVGLEGELGAGKTSFAQGFAKGLGVKEKVLSPTFLIMRKYQIPKSLPVRQAGKFQNLYHVDCYRIQNSKELLALGWRKIVGNPQNIVLVEWADRIKKILPRNSLRIVFVLEGQTTRRLVVQ